MRAVVETLSGDGVFARVARSIGWTASGFGATQALRFASNLILTRLLFPEAFGLMALVTVFMTGLAMFSDVGLGPSIMQNKRGDDRDFLDTAWTIQVIRGVCLWLATLALALPVAHFYGEPILAQLLPVAGLTLVIAGFNPTRIYTANRHLALGRVVAIELVVQLISITFMIVLAWKTQSIWALVVGGIIGAIAHLALAHVVLPGTANRFRWDPSAARELVHFGKWLFLSTALGFLVLQGDKAILGKYLSLEMLGIYNIGYFLASFPMMLGGAIISRILIPLYRERSPRESQDNFRKLRWVRFGLSGSLFAMLAVMAVSGALLVEVLYDPRYAAAGGIVVIIACIQAVQLVGFTYDQAALAAGDARSYFLLFVGRATLQIALFLIGVEMAGLVGALAGQGVALLAIHPMVVWLARRHSAWDPWHDAVFGALCAILVSVALWINWETVTALAEIGA